MEKFRGFHGLIGDRETFPAKLFHSSFKLEYHGQTRKVILNSSAINKISRIHAVGTPRIGIAVTVSQATLCDFQLDTILQPHCLAISVKVRKRQVKR